MITEKASSAFPNTLQVAITGFEDLQILFLKQTYEAAFVNYSDHVERRYGSEILVSLLIYIYIYIFILWACASLETIRQ